MFLEWIAIGALVCAASFDLRHRLIPDATAIIVALSGLTAAVMDGELASAVAYAAILFAAGACLFWLGVMGGGDVKLIAAMGFWLTPATLAPFLLIMAMTGGVLALGIVVTVTLSTRSPTLAIPTVPYGVAIAVSGLFILLGTH